MAFKALYIDSISTWFDIGIILNKSIPIIIIGSAMCLVFQTSLFSLGAEGQLYVGAFFGSLAAIYINNIPVTLHIIVVFSTATISAALYGNIGGVLKIKWGVNEVVSTLMLNYIAILITSYFVNNIFKDPSTKGYSQMAYINKNLLIDKITPSNPVHYGIFIAIAVVIITLIILYKTKFGYELRLVGNNEVFAHYGGISKKKVIFWTSLLSGAFCGMAGIVEILGIHGTYKDNFSAGVGFDGIIVAILAKNNPINVLIIGLLYAYIQHGSQMVQLYSDVPREIAVIIKVILIVLASSKGINIRFRLKRKLQVERE